MVKLTLIVVLLFSFSHYQFAQSIDLNNNIKLKPVGGGVFSLDQFKINTASVVIFLSPECPICIKMAKTIQEISDSFTQRGVKFYLIYPGVNFSKSQIRKFQKVHIQHLQNIQGYMDENNQLTAMLNAVVTPQVFVVNPKGEVEYSGKIDNWFEDISKRRTVITEFYLYDALSSLLAHSQIKVKITKPVGCFINR